MLTPEKIEEIAGWIKRLLPDDPREAITVLAFAYAWQANATNCDDQSAIEAIRAALKQIRN